MGASDDFLGHSSDAQPSGHEGFASLPLDPDKHAPEWRRRRGATADLRTKIQDFGGFDSSGI